MIQQPTNTKSVTTSGIENSVTFGIKSDGLPHLFNVLRNQLYSDKELAIIREYSTNAADAHVEAGIADTPIEITLPTKLSPTFKIRDFGLALNDSEIQDVYAFYGESTKRQSNAVTGQLGLGSKSAFAYGDNFVIHSYIDGVKHIHNAYLDPSGLGKISKLGTEKTDQKNGLEIVIAIKSDDIDSFKETAMDFYRWFNPRPVIHGGSKIEDVDVLYEGDGWHYLSTQNHSAMAVMGNIAYPVDRHSLNFTEDDGDIDDILTRNLVLNFEIGDLEIAASREKLQYTDYTKKNIKKKLKVALKEIMASITNSFAGCDTLFDAKCLYGATFDYSSNLYDLHRIIGKNLKWRGKLVECNTFHAHGKKVSISQFTKGRTGKYRPTDKHSINCDRDTVIVENDMLRPNGTLGRVLPMLLKENKKVYMIRFKDNEARKEYVKETGFDAKVVKLSELPKNKLTDFSEWGYGRASYVGGSGTSNPKSNKKLFKFVSWDEPNYILGDRNQSQHWEICEELPSEGIYVELDAYKSKILEEGDIRLNKATRIVEFIKKLKVLDDTLDVDVYGVKATQTKKVEALKNDPNWTDLYTWAKNKALELIEAKNLSQMVVDRAEVKSLEYAFDIDRHDSDFETLSANIIKEDSLAKQFVDAQILMHHKDDAQIIDEAHDIARTFNLTLAEDAPPTHDLSKMLEKFNKKYSMLKHVDGWRFKYNFKPDQEAFKDTINYINVVDLADISRKR